ncbi:Xanthotoxin 5-hydroxylase CYP82C4 [Citrus sinensis]|uniref:Xanthotoxin 5-hydroxylase CYP82C4 n=2 Tax=Citrus sinensis TaxID=2711 RepID=A0ACB8KG03_CITSI|nr:Xanthotoxin 5-hydroxylase CYP82C4 [Citrus sinensis]
MLPLQPKFKFLNIRYTAYEIRIAVYTPEAYCPTTGLPFVRIRLAAFNSDRFCPTSGLPIFHIRQVDEEDIKNLVHLQAILKEAFRLYPAVPFLVPHESMEECTINGYHVPARTQLFINAWKIQRDPSVWEEPSKFQPERFLTRHKDIYVKGQNFELLPFSSGRRMCPRVSFSLQVMQFTLASLLQGFDFATRSNEPVDMGEGLGLTMEKSQSFEVLVTPCLSAAFYD